MKVKIVATLQMFENKYITLFCFIASFLVQSALRGYFKHLKKQLNTNKQTNPHKKQKTNPQLKNTQKTTNKKPTNKQCAFSDTY